jgi:cellobiose phosphorylase
MEDGKLDFLNEKVPFFDGGEGSVYEHLCRSIEFTNNNIGENGFPLMLTSDWNDMLYKVCREGKGTSIWMAMFLGFALPKLAELAELLNKKDDSEVFMKLWKEQQKLVNTLGWDGKWFRRATMDDGSYLGTAAMDEAKIFLNTQSWSVMSGMADKDKMITAMDSVKEILDTDLGIRKIWPSIVNFPTPEDPLSHYNKGTGENGAIFCHANTWAIIAECMLGNGDRAWKYYHQIIPKIAMETAGAWRYKAEPYVYASNFFGPENKNFGLANVSWLTGTASWMYVAATQYILGIRPEWKGLLIDPCLPSDWEHISVKRVFRGCTYNIAIHKSKGICKGVKQILVDGKIIEGNVVPFENASDEVVVKVQML